MSAPDEKAGSGSRDGSVSQWYGSGSAPKCHGSTTLERMKGKNWQGNQQDGKEFTGTVCVQALIVEEPSSEPRETKPANLVQLKTSTTALRWSIQLFRISVLKMWNRISYLAGMSPYISLKIKKRHYEHHMIEAHRYLITWISDDIFFF